MQQSIDEMQFFITLMFVAGIMAPGCVASYKLDYKGLEKRVLDVLGELTISVKEVDTSPPENNADDNVALMFSKPSYTFGVFENEPVETVIGILSAIYTDSEPSGDIIYSIKGKCGYLDAVCRFI